MLVTQLSTTRLRRANQGGNTSTYDPRSFCLGGFAKDALDDIVEADDVLRWLRSARGAARLHSHHSIVRVPHYGLKGNQTETTVLRGAFHITFQLFKAR